MILGVPNQVILYNSLSMLPQSYRHYPTYPIRAVVTSIIHREVLLYLTMYQFINSVNNEFNVLQRNKEKDHFPFHIYIGSYFIYTIYNNIHLYLPFKQKHITVSHHIISKSLCHYIIKQIIMSTLSLSNHHIMF